MPEARLERTRKAYPASGSCWVYARLLEYDEAEASRDKRARREVVIELANRCAQAILYCADHGLALPPERDAYWERRSSMN